MTHRDLTKKDDPKSAVEQAWPVDSWDNLHVLAAVSGGPDSVAMLRILAAIKAASGGVGRLMVMHYDHQVRGQESRLDSDWVQQLCAELGLECFVGSSTNQGMRSEEALRDERRAFYLHTAHKVGARYVATAHTADDQAETVLFRLLRGSGMAGLRGIAPFAQLSDSVTLVRPLLEVAKKSLLTYLANLGQSYRSDPTNEQLDATRNWIRQELIPAAKLRFGADVSSAVCRISDQAIELHDFILSQAETLLSHCEAASTASRSTYTLCRIPLMGGPPVVAREALRLLWRKQGWPEKGLAQRHWESLFLLAIGQSEPTLNLPGNIIARRVEDRLEFTAPSFS